MQTGNRVGHKSTSNEFLIMKRSGWLLAFGSAVKKMKKRREEKIKCGRGSGSGSVGIIRGLQCGCGLNSVN